MGKVGEAPLTWHKRQSIAALTFTILGGGATALGLGASGSLDAYAGRSVSREQTSQPSPEVFKIAGNLCVNGTVYGIVNKQIKKIPNAGCNQTTTNNNLGASVNNVETAAKGRINEPSGGNIHFGYEEVQYYPDGSRDLLFALNKKDLKEGALVDEIDEGCYKNISSDSPGHELVLADEAIHSGPAIADSSFCADDRLTPTVFAAEPLSLGVPGYITQQAA